MAEHKLSKSRLEIRTALSPDVVLDIAAFVAGETRVEGWKYNKKVTILLTDRSEAASSFRIGQKRPLLMFDVTTSTTEGATTVVTSIEDFATIQSTIGGFIPAGPKTMEGYPWYHQFLTNLEAGVRAKDPQAKTAIIERDLG